LRFAHKLALALGIPKVSALTDDLSASEFGNWLAFYELEPFGPEVDDVRHAQLMALMTTAHGRRAWSVDEFLLGARRNESKGGDGWGMALMWARRHNATAQKRKRES
jgi:hypothetical protein